MHCFGQSYGIDWADWYPVVPHDLLGWELQQARAKADGTAALDMIETAEMLGLPVSGIWISTAHAIFAVQSALRGDYPTANQAYQQALAWERSALSEQPNDE